MGMVINNNLDSIRVYNAYSKNAMGLSDSMYKVSTSKRINFAGDDPSGIGLSERVRTRIDSISQAKKNLQNDSAIMKMADGALSTMSEIVSSMREKIVQAADSNISSAERANLKTDVDNLITRYTEVVSDAKYNDMNFFTSGGASAYTSVGFMVHYGADAGDRIKITFDKLDAATLKLNTSNVSKHISGTSIASANVTTVLATIDDALKKISAQQASLGTYEQRLGYLSDMRTNESTALTELDSSIRDLDMAKGMTDFMKYNIQTQASQIMLAQTGQSASMVLRLLE